MLAPVLAELDTLARSIQLIVVALVAIMLLVLLVLLAKTYQNASKIVPKSNMGLLELASGDSPTIEFVLNSMHSFQIELRFGKHCRNPWTRWGPGDILDGWRGVMAS
jgi:hypothetical protein